MLIIWPFELSDLCKPVLKQWSKKACLSSRWWALLHNNMLKKSSNAPSYILFLSPFGGDYYHVGFTYGRGGQLIW